jgi:glycosyltransferase involved in cell wall biosynthesis
MKIAIDARELHGKPTGVGRLLRKLLEEWRGLPAAQMHEFVRFEPTPEAPTTGTLWEQLVLPRLVRKARADVLLAPAYSGPLLSPVPMVVAIHDVSFAAHPEWFAWREGTRRRATTRLAARAAARIITISEFSKREIVAHLAVEPSKITVAYPGVTAFTGTSDTRGTSLNGSRVGCTVLFVGSIFNRRHIPELIDGFARLARSRSEMQLEIVGDNRTTPRADFDALIQKTGLADRIHLRSFVSDNELHQLYADASAFVFLSEYEGFGLTPLEALASELPVLLLDTPVAREVCGDAPFYVPRPDPALIAHGLNAVLFDAGERRRILDAARHVLHRYSWTTFAQQVLDALIEGGTRRRAGAEPRFENAPRQTP